MEIVRQIAGVDRNVGDSLFLSSATSTHSSPVDRTDSSGLSWCIAHDVNRPMLCLLQPPTMCRRRLIRTAAIAFVSVAAAVRPISADQQPTTAELIQQLGASSFQLREQAERQLQQHGAQALDELRAAVNDSDLEIRYRAHRLVSAIENQLQWRLLEEFLTNYDPELAHQLSGWSLYKELVGDDVAARQLFVNMYEAEPEIMSAIDRAPPALSLILERRSTELRSRPNRPTINMAVPAASTATLLLASLEPAAQATSQTSSLIGSQIKGSSFERAAAASTNPPILRLLSAWVSQATDVPASTRMMFGDKFDLKAAIAPALELIRAQAHGSQLQYAVFTVARLGNAEHIPVLEGLLDNATILSERQRGDDESFSCQVRDVALAALIHLVGKHPRDFGFTELRTNSNSVYALNTAGFDSEERRDAAFRQWRLWKQLQHQHARDAAENAVEGVGL